MNINQLCLDFAQLFCCIHHKYHQNKRFSVFCAPRQFAIALCCKCERKVSILCLCWSVLQQYQQQVCVV